MSFCGVSLEATGFVVAQPESKRSAVNPAKVIVLKSDILFSSEYTFLLSLSGKNVFQFTDFLIIPAFF